MQFESRTVLRARSTRRLIALTGTAVIVGLTALGGGAAPALADPSVASSTASNGVIAVDEASPITRVSLNDRFMTQIVASDPSMGAAFYRPTELDGATNTAIHAVDSTGTLLFDSKTMAYTGTQDAGGSGTPSDPFWLQTTASTIGSHSISQRHNYTVGNDFTRSDLTFTNRSGSAQEIKLSAWGDCYFAGSDKGYSAVDSTHQIATCTHGPDGPTMSFVSLSPGSSVAAGYYSMVRNLALLDYSPLPNACAPADCDLFQDNGMAIAFHIAAAPGESVTVSYYTQYSWAAGFSDLRPRITASNSSAFVGDEVTYTIDVSNAGTAAATNAYLQFPLPAGFQYVSSASPAGTDYEPATSRWNLGTIDAGAARSITITARATAPGTATAGVTLVGSDMMDVNTCSELGHPNCGGTVDITVMERELAGDATISTSPDTVVADGTSSSIVTVTLRDQHGDPIAAAGHDVAIPVTMGSAGPVTDNGDGTYSASWTSTSLGTGTASFTVDGVNAAPTASVNFIAVAADVVDDRLIPGPVSDSTIASKHVEASLATTGANLVGPIVAAAVVTIAGAALLGSTLLRRRHRA